MLQLFCSYRISDPLAVIDLRSLSITLLSFNLINIVEFVRCLTSLAILVCSTTTRIVEGNYSSGLCGPGSWDSVWQTSTELSPNCSSLYPVSCCKNLNYRTSGRKHPVPFSVHILHFRSYTMCLLATATSCDVLTLTRFCMTINSTHNTSTVWAGTAQSV